MDTEFGQGIHVAIIMDGNGRWATRRGLPRVAGHRAGVGAARRIVEHAPDVGIRRLTLYAFSSDNWRRPPAEVESIFWLLRAFLRLETQRLKEQGVCLKAIGRRDRLPEVVLRGENALSCLAIVDKIAYHCGTSTLIGTAPSVLRHVLEKAAQIFPDATPLVRVQRSYGWPFRIE
jgi:hypothetical protein